MTTFVKKKKNNNIRLKKNDLGAKTETARAIINQACIDDICFVFKAMTTFVLQNQNNDDNSKKKTGHKAEDR